MASLHDFPSDHHTSILRELGRHESTDEPTIYEYGGEIGPNGQSNGTIHLQISIASCLIHLQGCRTAFKIH